MKNNFFILFFLAVILASYFFLFAFPQKLQVDFLDVGQGDATLIETPFGQNILIDGGPDKSVVRRLGEELPFWDRVIDLMILTHPHDDHAAGLIEVLKRYDVKKIIYTGVLYDSADYQEWLKRSEEEGAEIIILPGPQKIFLGADCFLDILYPFENIAGRSFDNINNSSIVSRLDCAGKKVLFAGDAEEEVEKEMIEKNIDLSADIFKASHHASKTANTLEFLRKISPEYVVIEMGADNKYGYPHARAIKNFAEINAEVSRTDQSGTLVFDF